jgi:hypothetical protein
VIIRQFYFAHDQCVLPLPDPVSLPTDRFVIVPGNHDVDREIVKTHDFIEVGLREQLRSTGAINSFIDKVISGAAPDAAQLALARLSNYTKYVDTVLRPTTSFKCPFSSVTELTIKDTPISVACFNTAWRATGEPGNADYGRLILGERSVDLASAHIGNPRLRLAAFHHPLRWLNEHDAQAAGARLYTNFDVLLFGHVHVASPEITTTAYGRAALGQSGCLYQNRDYFNGYALLSVDTDARSVASHLRTYIDRRRHFDLATDVFPNGHVVFELSSRTTGAMQTAIEEVLRGVRSMIRMRGNKHLATISCFSDQTYDINNLFVCPPMRHAPDYRTDQVQDEKDAAGFSVSEILSDSRNYIFRGTRESGRTHQSGSLPHGVGVRGYVR